MSYQNIAFVGVGRMGANMTRRLNDRGYNITAVNDINQEAAAELAVELGAKHCKSLGKLTACGKGALDKSAISELTFRDRS